MTPPLRASCPMTLREVAEAVGVTGYEGPGQGSVTGVATDSRHVLPGDLFVALVGKAQDGHGFLADAVEAGAGAVLVERSIEPRLTVPALVVPDTTAALGALGQAWRRRLGLPLVAVTGSNGKTSTKEMLAGICGAHLGGREFVLVTPGNFNNHVGLPLTLLSATPSQRLGVVELGMNAPGEIAALTALAEPVVGIITNASEAHLAGFGGSVDGVARAKAELWTRMPKDAVAVVNLDDPRLPGLAAQRPGPRLTFGESESAQVRILATSPTVTGGQRVSLDLSGYPLGGVLSESFADCRPVEKPARGARGGGEARPASPAEGGREGPPLNGYLSGYPLQVDLPLWGRHHAWNVAAAAAGALALGISPEAIREGLGQIRLPDHRSVLLKVGGVIVLDDCYNANPASVRAAFSSLVELGGQGRTGAVLGDLQELGCAAEDLHRALGRHLAAAGLQVLIGVGPLCAALCEGAREGGVTEAIHTESVGEAAALARQRFLPGDRVLVKGSRSMAMEEVIKAWAEAAGEEEVA